MKKLTAREIIQQLLPIVPESRQDVLNELQEKVSGTYKKLFTEQSRKTRNAPLLEVIRACQNQVEDMSDSGGVI